MIVPVWFQAWELGCCLGELVLGQTCSGRPVAKQLEDVVRTSPGPRTWHARDDGTIDFTTDAGQTASVQDREPVLLDLGSLMIAARDVPLRGPISARTRLGNGSHGAVEGAAADHVRIEGRIVRIRKVACIYEREGVHSTRVGFGDPIDVDRTSDTMSVAHFVDLDCPSGGPTDEVEDARRHRISPRRPAPLRRPPRRDRPPAES